jgi:hypothetical protein
MFLQLNKGMFQRKFVGILYQETIRLCFATGFGYMPLFCSCS